MNPMQQMGWAQTTTSIETVDAGGNTLRLAGVRGYVAPTTGKVYVLPNDVARAEFESWTAAFGLESRDAATLLMLWARPGALPPGYIDELYRVNKMMFYQAKKLEERGFGDALPHDEFEAIEKGPRPKNLKQDVERLEKAGLFEVVRGKHVGIKLTPQGELVARSIWNQAAPVFQKETLRWKEHFFPMTRQNIMKEVHRDYPTWKAVYTEPDDE